MTDYIHGFSNDEMSRLTRMQEILNDAELDVLDLDGVRTVLDVGCGLGQMSRAIARRCGARVVGIERDPRQREEAHRQARDAGESGLVDIRDGDAAALPLGDEERGSFDLAHARFLLEHVPDPAFVVREMVSAVRPGGRVALMDDDHEMLRLWPRVPDAERVWDRFWRGFEKHGCDPLIGRKFSTLLTEAGAEVSRITTVFYGAAHGTPMFDLVVDNLIEVMKGAMSPDEAAPGFEALNDWRALPDASLWYSLPFAEGRRPE